MWHYPKITIVYFLSQTISAWNLLECAIKERTDEVKIQKEDTMRWFGLEWKDISKHVIFDNWIHNIYWAFATCIDISIYGKRWIGMVCDQVYAVNMMRANYMTYDVMQSPVVLLLKLLFI